MGYFGGEVDQESAEFIFVMETLLAVAMIIYAVYYLWTIRAAVYHKSNKSIMQPRTLTIKQTEITVHENDNHWTYKKEDCYCIATLSWCYLFFPTINQFVFISKNAFQNQKDRELFEKTILPVYPPRKKRLLSGILNYFICLAIGIAIAGVLLMINP